VSHLWGIRDGRPGATVAPAEPRHAHDSPMSHARSFVHRLRWAESGFGVLLAVLVVDVFVVAPIAQEEMLVALQPAVHAIVLASGVAIAARSRPTTLTAVGVLAVVGLGIHIVYHLHPSPPLRRLDTAMSLLFCTILGGVILAQILRPGRISLHRIGGAVTLYLLIAYSWALAYQLVALHDVAAFHWPAAALEEQRLRFQLLYFSLSTLTGVSYGDITPLNAGARSLAALEGVMGQLFPVVLLARLVSMELRDRR